MHVCTHTHTHARTHTHTSMLTHMHTHVYTHALTGIQVQVAHTSLEMLSLRLERTQHPLSKPVQVPPNGLVVYTGTIMTEDGKEKKLNIDFEPFKPINTSLYLCDNKFHTEALNELLEADNKWVRGAAWMLATV